LRIFAVDDSIVVRKIVCDTLAEDRALAIMGSASDGRAALAKLPLVNPDLVTLDIEMPGMSGLETLVALRKAYPKLPVQRMPPVFTRQLAERLASRSAIPISEASEAVALESGHAWIAPGNFHMRVERTENRNLLHLNQGPQENSCRPSVDVLFRSVAQVFGGGVSAVVMTGMGNDGARGTEQIRSAGGEVIVQDEATSVV
jgi:two-component system chemotaxis response regulator CheB